MQYYHTKTIIKLLLISCIIICFAFFLIKVSKDSSHHLLAESQSPLVPGLDYDEEWITEMENLSATLNKSPAEILYMRWNSLRTSMDFGDRSELAVFVREEIPVDGNDLLSKHQLYLLHTAITEWLFCNGNNDRENYCRYLLESKETLTEDGQETIRKFALVKNRSDIMQMNSLQQLVWFYHEKKANIRWLSLVAEGARIKVFETESANLLHPGSAIRSINKRIRVYFRKTAPPISFNDELKNNGNVLVADLEIYITSDKGNIQPYFCRYWFDSVNSIWRLKSVVSYPRHRDIDITPIMS